MGEAIFRRSIQILSGEGSVFLFCRRHENLSISIPDSVRRRVEYLAQEDGVPVDAFVAAVLTQRVAVADADSYVRSRAKTGRAETMLEILRSAPKAAPNENDWLS